MAKLKVQMEEEIELGVNAVLSTFGTLQDQLKHSKAYDLLTEEQSTLIKNIKSAVRKYDKQVDLKLHPWKES